MRLRFAIPLLFLLAGCTAFPPVVRQSVPSSHSSSSVTSVSPLPEYGDADAALSSSSSAPAVALAERLTGSGVLEIGKADAPFVLLNFTHQSCSYCRDFLLGQFPSLLQDFIASGQVRYQIVLLPFHKYPQSEAQTKTLFCAATQGKGLAMHTLLFQQSVVDRPTALLRARDLQLDIPAFQSCMDDPATKSVIDSQARMATRLGVTLVPTYFLNGEQFVGLPDYADLRGRIETMSR